MIAEMEVFSFYFEGPAGAVKFKLTQYFTIAEKKRKKKSRPVKKYDFLWLNPRATCAKSKRSRAVDFQL